MNKRGDVPTVLVLIGALMIYITAFYLLYTTGNTNDLEDLSVLGKEANLLQDLIEQEAKGIIVNASECLDKYNNKVCIQNVVKNSLYLLDNTDFFGKIRVGEFEYSKSNDGYELIVTGIKIRLASGENKLERTFDINVNTNRQ